MADIAPKPETTFRKRQENRSFLKQSADNGLINQNWGDNE
jgi:hypothetical protein